MEAEFALRCLSGASAFLAAFVASVAADQAIRKSHRRSNAQTGMSATQSGWLARCVRNGVSFLRPLAGWLLGWARLSALLDEAVWLLLDWGYVATSEALLSLALAIVAFLALAVGLVTWSPVAACAACACAIALCVALVKTAQDKRRTAIREAVPDALRAMEVCFQSGLSLLQTFQQVAKEAKGPLRLLFVRGVHLLETGHTTREALEVFRSGALVPELAFVAVALDVQHQTGGSMGQVLESARETVEGELELERSLRVQTAQARLSARIVSVMPFVLIMLFSLVSENFLAPFFASVTGVALLAMALAMQVAGVLLVRRMLKVEVGS